MAEGIIYVLGNPVYQAAKLLKIGKTARTAHARAKELARATGVPDDFEVLHEQFFDDCDKAEKNIHELLKDYRYKKNKEFFEVDLHIAIKHLDDLKIKELSIKIEDLKTRLDISLSATYKGFLKNSLRERTINEEIVSDMWNRLPNSIKFFNMYNEEEKLSISVENYIDCLSDEEEREIFCEIIQSYTSIYNFDIDDITFNNFKDNTFEILYHLAEQDECWKDRILENSYVEEYKEEITIDFFNSNCISIKKDNDEFEFLGYLDKFPLLEKVIFLDYSSNDIVSILKLIEKVKDMPQEIKHIEFELIDIFENEKHMDNTIQKLQTKIENLEIEIKQQNLSLFDTGKKIKITKYLVRD